MDTWYALGAAAAAALYTVLELWWFRRLVRQFEQQNEKE